MTAKRLMSWCLAIMLFVGCSPVLKSTKYSEQQALQPEDNCRRTGNKMVYALPKGLIKLKQQRVQSQTTFTIDTIFVPDPKHVYFIEHCNNPWFTDSVRVTTDSQGLMKAIDITSTSDVKAILLEVVEVAKSLAKLTTLAKEDKNSFEIDIDPDTIPDDPRSKVFLDYLQKKISLDKELKDIQKDIDDIKSYLVSFKNKNQTNKDIPSSPREEMYNELKNKLNEKYDYKKLELVTLNDKMRKELLRLSNEKVKNVSFNNLGIDFISINWLDSIIPEAAAPADNAT